MREFGIGIIGCGVVGSEVVRGLIADRDVWRRRWGVSPVVRRVAVRDLARARGVDLPPAVLTTSVGDVVEDPTVQAVVEVTGQVDEARTWLLAALDAGKHVVTANKALLARHMGELQERARKWNLTLAYEATVAGGIPVVRAIRDGLVAYGITEIVGILNGTTHFVLSRMEADQVAFSLALAEAQRCGFAEPDPTEDVTGRDSACKLAILAQVALSLPVTLRDVYHEGIDAVAPRDLALAKKLGYRIKPVAVARRSVLEGRWELRVHPALVPLDTLLGRLEREQNGVRVTTERGCYFFSGHGAGGPPTAGAVLGDLLEVALRPGPYPAVDLADHAFTVTRDQFVTGHYFRVRGDARVLRGGLESRDVPVAGSLQDGDEAAIVTGRGTPAVVLSALAAIQSQAPAAWLRVEDERPA